MIEIYADKELEIYFSETPHIDVRYLLPWQDKKEQENIIKFPFENKKEFKVYIVDIETMEDYTLTVEKGYCWDGATIPRFLWSLIGSKTDNSFLIPSCIHDILCNNHDLVCGDRNLSSRVFKALLLASGVSKFKAQTMYLAVDNFQKLCGWNENK